MERRLSLLVARVDIPSVRREPIERREQVLEVPIAARVEQRDSVVRIGATREQHFGDREVRRVPRRDHERRDRTPASDRLRAQLPSDLADERRLRETRRARDPQCIGRFGIGLGFFLERTQELHRIRGTDDATELPRRQRAARRAERRVRAGIEQETHDGGVSFVTRLAEAELEGSVERPLFPARGRERIRIRAGSEQTLHCLHVTGETRIVQAHGFADSTPIGVARGVATLRTVSVPAISARSLALRVERDHFSGPDESARVERIDHGVERGAGIERFGVEDMLVSELANASVHTQQLERPVRGAEHHSDITGSVVQNEPHRIVAEQEALERKELAFTTDADDVHGTVLALARLPVESVTRRGLVACARPR